MDQNDKGSFARSGDVVAVYATFPDRDSAVGAARALVEANLTACANIIGPMMAVYRWQGSIETAEEVVMIAKTQSALADKVVAAIVEQHTYDVPAVIVLPVAGGSPSYLDWIKTETAPGLSSSPVKNRS